MARKKIEKIYLNTISGSKYIKTKLGQKQKTYVFKLYGTDSDKKKYYVVRLTGKEFMPILLEGYIKKYGLAEGSKRFEEFLEVVGEIANEGLSPFKLTVAPYEDINEIISE